MHDSPSLQIEKEQDEDRAEEHVEGLHEVTSPGDVVAKEGTPALAVAGDPLLHVPLHGAFRDRIPSLSNSPRSRSAPHLGFRAAISRMSDAKGVGLRPPDRDRHCERRRKPSRCHEAEWPAAPASPSSATKPSTSSGVRSSSAASP